MSDFTETKYCHTFCIEMRRHTPECIGRQYYNDPIIPTRIQQEDARIYNLVRKTWDKKGTRDE
jgi:hypothetical protein